MKPLVFVMILTLPMLFTVGCGGKSAPPPTESESLERLGVPVWRFIAQAQKQKNKTAILSELGMLMESLDAQSENTGGKLTQLRDAAVALQSALQGGTSAGEAIQHFADKVRPLVAEPASLE